MFLVFEDVYNDNHDPEDPNYYVNDIKMDQRLAGMIFDEEEANFLAYTGCTVIKLSDNNVHKCPENWEPPQHMMDNN